jgi:type I restriction enzyme, R subunit
MSAEARQDFAAYIPDGDMGRFAGGLPKAVKNAFADTMAILRDKDFQDLLVNYQRARRSFIVAPEQVDEVSSEKLVMGQKPEDYLESFARFVRENPDHIEAINILLKRPKQWRTDVLNDLRQKLEKARFPEKQLQQAHRLVYNMALADIISMVKHAAKEQEPVMTAEERVARAMAKVAAGRSFTTEQQKWLGYIKEHLTRNLTFDVDDLEAQPVFTDRGGKKTAERLFGRELQKLAEEINFAMAA